MRPAPPLGQILLQRRAAGAAYQPGPLEAFFIRFCMLIIIGVGLLLGLMIEPVPLAGLWVISPALSRAVSAYVCGVGCVLLVASYLVLESLIGDFVFAPLLALLFERCRRSGRDKAQSRYFLFVGLKLLALGAAGVGWYMASGGWAT